MGFTVSKLAAHLKVNDAKSQPLLLKEPAAVRLIRSKRVSLKIDIPGEKIPVSTRETWQ